MNNLQNLSKIIYVSNINYSPYTFKKVSKTMMIQEEGKDHSEKHNQEEVSAIKQDIQKKKLKVFAVSDIHGQYWAIKKLKEIQADILIIGGDFTYYGKDEDFNMFFDFLDSLKKIKHKIVIAGNHQIIFDDQLDFERKSAYLQEYPCKYSKQYLVGQLKKRAIYLQHQFVSVEGLKIFGSPYTTYYCGSAFQLKPQKLKFLWDQIPNNLDILITHSPPFGIFDKSRKKQSSGCPFLLQRVKQVKPKVHIFGHIHEGRPSFGQPNNIQFNGTRFYNVAYKFEQIDLSQQKHQ